MSLKKIRKDITVYCNYCSNDNKVKAVWKLHYLSDVACDLHKSELQKKENKQYFYFTEADYQTWINI